MTPCHDELGPYDSFDAQDAKLHSGRSDCWLFSSNVSPVAEIIFRKLASPAIASSTWGHDRFHCFHRVGKNIPQQWVNPAARCRDARAIELNNTFDARSKALGQITSRSIELIICRRGLKLPVHQVRRVPQRYLAWSRLSFGEYTHAAVGAAVQVRSRMFGGQA